MSKLNSAKRKALPKKEFAIPSKKTAKNPAGKGAYPIPDASHAKNALARVAQFGSPAQKAQVRAAVRKHFPNVGKPGPATDNDSAKVKKLEANQPDPKTPKADARQDQRLASMGVNVDIKTLNKKLRLK